MKIHLHNAGHMTKMAAMPIYGKNTLEIFFPGTTGLILMKLAMNHQRPKPIIVFSSPEPKAHGELIVYQSSRRASVRASTLLNINISETSGPIATKFYLKHHWAGGKAASGFWPDQIGTLVSMATDSSHRVIMGKILLAL